ncbi:toxic anion resistance protein [Chitinimonas sp.]|uniref:toxic anion resistance protein n=1 Tax=Chitinimonas sp. TaxID=1934313 RepID=UPI0035AF61C6
MPARLPATAPVAKPAVLFADRAVTAEQLDAEWHERVMAARVDCDCTDFGGDVKAVQRVRNLYGEIRFVDAHFQSDYAAEVTELMRQLQDQLAVSVGGSVTASLHQSALAILDAAQQVDVAALDPKSWRSRLSDWLQGSAVRRIKLRQQFDAAAKAIAIQLANAQPALAELKRGLQEYSGLFARNEMVFEQLTEHVLAAQIKLMDVRDRELPALEQRLSQQQGRDPFAWQEVDAMRDAIEQWQRKLGNLKLLRHTALLTLPQLRLSQRNLLAMVGRFNDIQEIVIPNWKQQFITALALSDGGDKQLFDAISRLQAGLRTQLEQLTS